jgi:hypothetical protein
MRLQIPRSPLFSIYLYYIKIYIYNSKLTFFEFLMRIPVPRARTDAAAANAAAATIYTPKNKKNEDASPSRELTLRQSILLLPLCTHTQKKHTHKVRMPVQASGFDAFAKGLGCVSFVLVDALCQGFVRCIQHRTHSLRTHCHLKKKR